jgi:hypothetical protein
MVVLVAVMGLAAAVSFLRGPRVALAWIYLPALMLIPLELTADVPVFPDLTSRRSAAVGLLVGAILSGRGAQLVPRWRGFDLLPLAAVTSFSISFALTTEPLGFVHAMAVGGLDWLLPYAFARALWRDHRDLRDALKPLAIAATLLAVLCLYEARMASRIAREFWSIATGLYVPGHWPFWRWGFLRAFGTFNHPIVLGVVFATLTPLMVIWSQLAPRYRRYARVAALACAAGCITSISRGPIVALLAGGTLGVFLARRRSAAYVAILLALPLVIPLAMGEFNDAVEYTQHELDSRGNVDSGYYRLALLMIYLDDISKVGWFGNENVVAQDYEAAWSIDNAYLFLFVTGGWLGGGLFLAMIFSLLTLAGQALGRDGGDARRVRAAGMASLLAMLAGMFNVWFSPDYAPLFFLTLGLVLNQTRRAWFGKRTPALPPRPPPTRRPDRAWVDLPGGDVLPAPASGMVSRARG